MSKNSLQKLADYGQSIWLDYIRRKMLDSGELKQMIEDGLRGVTLTHRSWKKRSAAVTTTTAPCRL